MSVEKKRRAVLVGGAGIERYDLIKGILRPDDFLIFCDSGLKHQEGLGVRPDLIIGDFDSWEDPHAQVETIVLPRAKDDTDTVFAAKEAVKRGFDDFLMIGVMGGRLDHTLANVYCLLWLRNRGASAWAADDWSEMTVILPGETAEIPPAYPFFSLVSIKGDASGVTVKNALFPLEDGVITSEYQYAVSNEPLPGKTALVTLTSGALLLIMDRR